MPTQQVASSRIRQLVKLVRNLSEAQDPRSAVDLFVAGMNAVFGPWGYVGVSTAAAVVMAMMHAYLESYSHPSHDPERVLAYLNRRLCRNPIENSFVTAIGAIFESDTRRLSYACAGHPPILRRPGARAGTAKLQRLDFACSDVAGGAAVPSDRPASTTRTSP